MSSSSSSSSAPPTPGPPARKGPAGAMELVTAGGKGGLLGPRTHQEVFGIVETGKRREVEAVVRDPAVSLGMVDPTSGRSLLHRLLTTVTNGDKIVLSKLDSCVSTTGEDEDRDDWAVLVDHRCLVDEDPRNMSLVTDLLRLPTRLSSKVLSHPVLKTFIENRWRRTRFIFLLSFFLYLLFVVLLSSFVYMMYQRDGFDTQTIKVDLPAKCDKLQPVDDGANKGKKNAITTRSGFSLLEAPGGIDVTVSGQLVPLQTRMRGRTNQQQKDEVVFDDFELSLEVKKTRRRKKARANKKLRLFSSCKRKFWDIDLCTVEILLVIIIVLLITQEFWQMLALGVQYARELENWFELVIVGLAVTSLCLKHEGDSDALKIVSAVGICLAWIELIFLFGRYPFLGGMFSIMYYSVTKRIVKAALGFSILICAFAFSFFIIHFNNESESFDDISRTFIKVFVMILGEFEFNDLWESAGGPGSTGFSQAFTMLLLIFLILAGSLTMVNLIVAIIITDIEWLHRVSKEQVLLNQAQHAVQIHALLTLFSCLFRRKVASSTHAIPRDPLASLSIQLCLHSVCRCGKDRPGKDTRAALATILGERRGQ